MSATSTSGPPLALAAGARLGPYEIQSALGAGGMGEVYRAYDPKLKRDIAIKVLSATTARDAERKAGFEREAQSIAALNHPNIVTVYSVEEADGVLFLTMELVEGKPLSDLMMKGGQPLARILPLAIPLADAVSVAHRKGITHRDLKPANVMVTVDGRVKVLDFWPREADGTITGRRVRERASDQAGHERGAHRRNGRVHVARAGGGQSGRPPVGRLLARSDPVRDGDGRAPVQR
jgi:serine/threonine protein kinase